jgi:hypothetical protein
MFSPSLRRVRLLACMAFAGALAGCGGAPPPPAQEQPAQAPPQRPVVAVASPDLAPVPEPTHLVSLTRWRNPAASFATVRDWTGVPVGTKDALDTLGLADIAGLLADDAPVDAAVAIDPTASGLADLEPLYAVAVGLRSIEDGRKAGELLGSVTETGPGSYRLRIRKGGRRTTMKSCLISAAAGAAPARLVCGRRDRDLDALAAYLTRTLPSADLGPADVHVELRFPPIAQKYGTLINEGLHVGAATIPEHLANGEPTFDNALRRAASGLADELSALAGDLDRLTIDAALRAEGADFSVELRLRDRQSWAAGSLAAMAKRSGLPPPLFWRLPEASTFAGFSFGNDPERQTEIWRTMQELLDGYLLHEKVPPADRAALTNLMSPDYATGATWVGASSGPDWTLWGVADQSKSRDWAKKAMAACQRPQLLALAARIVSEQTGGQKKTRLAPAPLRCKATLPPADLPKGTLDFEISLAPPPALAPKRAADPNKGERPRRETTKIHVLVASQASETWIAVGADRAKLVAPILAVMHGPSAAATLARREGLDGLRAGSLAGGGFVTLETFVRFFARLASAGTGDIARPDDRTAIEQALEATPKKGRTPMLFSSSVAGAGAVVWTGRFAVPRAVFQDLAVLAVASALRGGGPGP